MQIMWIKARSGAVSKMDLLKCKVLPILTKTNIKMGCNAGTKKQRRHRYEWFKNRIGKRVWRMNTGCQCEFCAVSKDSGFIITDKFHAHYLYTIQEEAGYRYTDQNTQSTE